MAIGRDAMTKELEDRRKRVLKVKELMGSSGGGRGASASMKMPSTAMPSAEMPSTAMPTSDMSAAPAMKKGGRVVEKASKEVFSSKAAMKKHEKGESKSMERKEDKMRGGGIAQKASKEVFSSKAAMKKHEKGESKATERKEDKMRGGGIAQRGMGVALKKGGSAKKPGMVVMIALGKGKKK
jgi:hypothetical protein